MGARRVSDPFRFDRALLDADPIFFSQFSRDLRLAGADEAGRGCLAGPLVAAAVVLDYERAPFRPLRGLTDSKLLSAKARERIYQGIVRCASRVTWTACSAATIDEKGLHRTNLSALERALELLDDEYGMAVVDAFDLGRADLRTKAFIGADFKSAAVAAASVVAKVVRDRLMRSMARAHPGYGFEEHVGYATMVHREALLRHGPCPLHRRSFRGVSGQQLEFLSD